MRVRVMKESLGVQYKVLRWSLAFFWWLMVTAGVVLIGCLVAFNAGWMDTDTATLDIPVEIQLEEGTYTLTQNEGIPGQVELEDVVGTLSVPLHDSHLGLWLLLILLYAAFMWGTKLLRDVVLSLLCRLVSGQFLAHRLRHAEVGDDSLALISDEINGRLQRVLRRLVGRELTSAPEQTPCCRLAKITGNIESVVHNYTQLDLFSP